MGHLQPAMRDVVLEKLDDARVDEDPTAHGVSAGLGRRAHEAGPGPPSRSA